MHPICVDVFSLSLLLSHTLFLWALKCGGSAFCAERDTSCRLMLCLLFWSGSQRAVVVHCWFSIHACPSLSTLNELQHPPWTQTYLYHQLWAGSKCQSPYPATLPHTCHTCESALCSFFLSTYLSLSIFVLESDCACLCMFAHTVGWTHTHTVISAAAEPATRGNGELWEECDLTWLHRSGLHMEQAHSWQMKKGPVQLRFRCQFMNMSLYINNSYWGLSRGYNIYIYIMTGTSFKISCIMCLLLSLNVNKAWTQDFLLLQNSLWPQMFCSLAWWLKQKHTFILH